ncbi:MAG: alpha-amylase family glycosyl hydrolase [Bacteroidetes bacterium]|nr:alpha-amylase family glycosyl hydrolase [Bacteroidota bacterium]
MKKTLLLVFLSSLLVSCQNSPSKESPSPDASADSSAVAVAETVKTTEAWANTATIYEVNIRQYSEEGTINAFREHLDRLQDLGIKILWIMPIQPIGLKNRKGEEGSYYSIANYHEVNPAFGSMEDFKALVQEAHDRDMKVILDWVANHTAFDHPWTSEHPEWYTRDSLGNIIPPVEDWSDVADLNYSEKGLWKAMCSEMKFWVNETNVDGFRCDVAMMVPMDFWNETRRALDSIKPVFMLAEAEGPDFHAAAFDMTYGWENHHIINEIAQGKMDFLHLAEFLAKEDTLYAPADLRMNFVTNHDENSWNGTAYERMGENVQNYYALCVGLKRSMPLIYSGQEAGLNRRLEFFTKDPIAWADTSQYAFYRAMSALKAEHPALANGAKTGDFKIIETDNENVFAFRRSMNDNQVIFYLNFGDSPVEVKLSDGWMGDSKALDYISGAELNREEAHSIPAHNFLIATNH